MSPATLTRSARAGEGDAAGFGVVPVKEWPLVGRAADLDLVHGRVADPGCRGVVLVGASGVGKTRLAREVMRRAADMGTTSTWVGGTRSARAIPFGALATLLPDVDSGQLDRIDNRADLLRRYVRAMEDAAGGDRLLLVVDDAHLLDDASATLVHQVVVRGKIFVLATVRAGEDVPDPVTALWKDELADRLDISGLETGAVGELLATVLGGQVDPATVAFLSVRCEGNVLFLRAIVQDAEQDGTLRQESGVWHLAKALAPSDRLVELVEGQLGALRAPERAMLEVLAYGEPLAAEELTALGDVRVAEVLERKGLLMASPRDGGLEFRLAHPLYGDVLRRTTPRLRAQSIARQLADALGRTSNRREDVLRAAVWRLEGGGASADQMLEAATIARWRYDFVLAEQLARSAVELGAGFEAALLSAQLAGLRGRPHEAESQLAGMAAVAQSDDHRGRVASARLDNLVLSLGMIADGLRVAAEVEDALDDPHWRDQIAARRLTATVVGDGPRAALDLAMALGARAKGTAHVFAGLGASISLCRIGRISEGLELSAETYTEHVRLRERMDWYPCLHRWVRGLGLNALGRFGEAAELATEEYEKGLREGCAEARAWFCWLHAGPVGSTGHVRPAVRWGREAVALFRQLGRPRLADSAAVSLAMALALQGRGAEAEAALEENIGSGHSMLNGVERARTRAWIALAHGDAREGRRLLEDAADLGVEIGDLVGHAAALDDLARLGYAAECADALCTIALDVEGDLVACQAAHAAALRSQDPAALRSVSSRFAGMGADLLAAEAAFDVAVSWQQAGDPRNATAASRHATLIASACEGAVTPALRSVQQRVVLTRSERETAMLAAAGHTNREIAQLQCLSMRTVENRLQQVYRKLGIAGRDEISAAMTE